MRDKSNYTSLPFKAPLFAAILFLLCLPVYAQHFNLSLEAFNTLNGLSQNQVYTIVQDKKGFMWFGTDEGLNRFDGYEFKIFRHDDNDPNSILDNSVHGLVVDDDGVLWIGTSNGVSRYYPDTELIEQLPVNYDDFSLPNGTAVNEIKKDNDGKIWIAYLGSGVDVFDPQSKEFFHYTVHREDEYRIINDYVIALQFMPGGEKLLGTRDGIQFINAAGLPLTEEEAQKKYPWKNSIDNSVTCLQLSASGKYLWIGTELNGFYRVDLQNHQVKNFNKNNGYLLFNNNIPSLFEDSKNNIWIGGEAIYRFENKAEALESYDEHGIQGNVVNKNPILSIFEDRDNNIWFGTFRLGVLKYNPYNTQIVHYHANQGEGSLKNNQVLSFNEDAEGNVWVGTDGGGLFRMRKDLKGFDPAPLNEKFSSQVIKYIYRDRDNNFWMGTWDGGMMKYHPGLKTLDLFTPERGNFESRHVWDMKSDGRGNFWLGTLRDGLAHFNPQTKEYRYFKSTPGDSASLVNNDITSLFMDSQDILWIGTSNGLSIRYPESNKFITPKAKELNIAILSIYEDSGNKVWLGTSGAGILIMNKNFKIEKVLTERDGLPSSTVCAMQPDKHGNVWVSTYNGLAKISYNDHVITLVPQIAGLQGKEFIPRSSFRTRDGKLLFGGVNGFNLFHPDSLHFNPSPKSVVFTSLKINNDEITPNQIYDTRRILEKSIAETDAVYLSYKDHSFTLTFSSLSYNWQGSLNFAYFLENMDTEWQYTNAARRFIHYTNLGPGKYILKVKASFDGKQWPDEAKILTIYIAPPWWATWWFRTAVLLLFALSLYTIYKTRVSYLQNQQIKLENLVKLRTQELKKSNVEIQSLLQEVAEKKEQIEKQMEELRHVNEEISAQRDTLESRSAELENTQSKLKEINATLELLVEKRTQKLSDALRELETFLYRASHDLRGPISTMLGLIASLRLEADPLKFSQIYTDFMERTVLGLDRTLQKLLQKHTLDKKKIVYEKIDKPSFVRLLDNVLKDIPFYRPNDFRFLMDDNVVIHTDKTMLQMILGNLLENAFFYSDRSGNKKVFLDVKRSEENAIKIIVEDHGPGIRHEYKDKIFTMFFRGNEHSTGNGLGLYLVKNVLQKVHGDITVETEEGKYSRFTAFLPAVEVVEK